MKDIRSWIKTKIEILQGAVNEADRDIARMISRNAYGDHDETIKQAKLLSFQWVVQIELLQDILDYLDSPDSP